MGSGIDPHATEDASPSMPKTMGGVFGQQTENQNMRMASTTKSDKTIGGHAHFLALSLLAKNSNRRYTNNVTLYAGVLARCAPIQIYKVAPTVPLTSAAYSFVHGT